MSSTNHQRASATDQQRASAPRTPESETDRRDSFNEGGSERGTAVTQRQRYKGRNGWVDEEWGTELGALLRLANEGNHFCSKDRESAERERPGYNKRGTTRHRVNWRERGQATTDEGPTRHRISWRERGQAAADEHSPAWMTSHRVSWRERDQAVPHGQHAYSGHVIKCLLVYDHCRFAKLAP